MDLRDGELTVLIGPSGCGEDYDPEDDQPSHSADPGEILIDGKTLKKSTKSGLRRNIGYVIQQDGLFPHMTIRQNIELIQRLEKQDEQAITDNTLRLMKMVDLDPGQFLDRYPTELSGGQRQRIGVIRALPGIRTSFCLTSPFFRLGPGDPQQPAG